MVRSTALSKIVCTGQPAGERDQVQAAGIGGDGQVRDGNLAGGRRRRGARRARSPARPPAGRARRSRTSRTAGRWRSARAASRGGRLAGRRTRRASAPGRRRRAGSGTGPATVPAARDTPGDVQREPPLVQVADAGGVDAHGQLGARLHRISGPTTASSPTSASSSTISRSPRITARGRELEQRLVPVGQRAGRSARAGAEVAGGVAEPGAVVDGVQDRHDGAGAVAVQEAGVPGRPIPELSAGRLARRARTPAADAASAATASGRVEIPVQPQVDRESGPRGGRSRLISAAACRRSSRAAAGDGAVSWRCKADGPRAGGPHLASPDGGQSPVRRAGRRAGRVLSSGRAGW